MTILRITNGRLIDPSQDLDQVADLWVQGERILAIGPQPHLQAARTLDAAGKLVCPGLIDMHVHLREPGREEDETIASGTAAALAGGITSLTCMPNTEPALDGQAAAEFEEARLRLRREISKDVERARRDVIAEMLDVVDNLERALDAARKSPNLDALQQGVEMVHRQFLSKLESLGVKPIAAASRPFDPSLHEAITTVPAASPDQDGIIVGVVRQGYTIGDEVLRPAAVAVAKSD